jgi:hypothetical protein
MKKINLYMLLIFIAALTGCDDNVNDHFALPQTNPQEPVQNVEGFTLSLGSSCTAPILFKDLDDATLLEVAKLTDHPELTEGDTINLEVEVSKDETFTQAIKKNVYSQEKREDASAWHTCNRRQTVAGSSKNGFRGNL